MRSTLYSETNRPLHQHFFDKYNYVFPQTFNIILLGMCVSMLLVYLFVFLQHMTLAKSLVKAN